MRKFKLNDTEDMYSNWANDDEVTRHLSWPTHKSSDVSASIIKSWVSSYENNETYNWAIEHKEIGEVIGSIGIVELNNIYERCSIGYCIGKAFWGKGCWNVEIRNRYKTLPHSFRGIPFGSYKLCLIWWCYV